LILYNILKPPFQLKRLLIIYQHTFEAIFDLSVDQHTFEVIQDLSLSIAQVLVPRRMK
jgi:hypothetical protein